MAKHCFQKDLKTLNLSNKESFVKVLNGRKKNSPLPIAILCNMYYKPDAI